MLDYITIDTTSVIIKRRYTINTNVNAVKWIATKKKGKSFKNTKTYQRSNKAFNNITKKQMDD